MTSTLNQVGAAKTILSGVLFLMLSGCVLTADQKSAVTQFANATSGYGTTAGAVLTSYSQDYITNHWTLAELSKQPMTGIGDQKAVDDAWASLQTEIDLSLKQTDQAARADAAIKILDTYSSLLSTLTSDDFTTALSTQATGLSNQIDAGIGDWNTKYAHSDAEKLPSFGSYVAEAVTGIGGIFIRYEQEKALKAAVIKADPAIRKLTDQISAFTIAFASVEIAAEQSQVKTDFSNAVMDAINQHRSLNYQVLSVFVVQAEKLSTLSALADKAGKAALAYGTAHAKLVEEVSRAQDTKQLLQEIATLQTQIKAAQQVKSSLDAKASSK